MTAYGDHYREMAEGARDAIYELLRGSRPDAWMRLRTDYGELRHALEQDDRERQKERERQEQQATDEVKDHHRRELAEYRDRHDAWKKMPGERRETLPLHVLGEERLILHELTTRMNAELGTPNDAGSTVYQPDVRNLVMAMFRVGQLERVEETFRNKPRYRYFRKRGLDGPIVDLERAYHHDDEAGGES